ncbi:rod shape-determining protein RodA [Acidisoma cellulosilytica]|uniref:Peptidoglycan glycosyltransferase MrdB n=1 Tax=Acidisoma cellulosilyticum TaxID=2802395 RepID=A0A964E6A4_9PROT|nr:rod shape-determining protein RodA [Acidisoma cellulosilyticum]MCB8883500.1 rod shape-determining protein RodA [Acidisoma cellulosilyticum]
MMERRLWREGSLGVAGKVWQTNWFFVLLILCLAAVGYVALYSAAGGSPEPYAQKQLVRFCIGLVIMVAIAMTDIRIIARYSWWLYALGIILLLVVAKFGHVGKGAQRWIAIGGFQLQPSELMKIFLALALGSWFQKASYEKVGRITFLIVPVLAILLPVGLILKEPNLGTAVITGAIGGAVLLAAGVRWWKFAIVIAGLAAAVPVGYHHLHDYQRQRILTFLHPERDPLGTGYNILQSKIALGSGGMWGRGFLNGSQGNLDFLPEKQTDFIFDLIAEQFGLVGSLSVLGLLLLIVLGSMLIALRCRHQFGRLVALGISVDLFLYVFVNIAMVMGAIPVGGVPLPLISYGGSVLITAMIAFGILMSVHVHRDVEFPEADG